MEELGWRPVHSSLENIIASACQWQEAMLASEGFHVRAGGKRGL
ncbi:MAG TPA: hypothetical protein VFC10_14700 [Terriglobia bacterium]|jgi:UDP-glucose 4-epimerase|nr:hypothetical protein [Terriglobia bacterium]